MAERLSLTSAQLAEDQHVAAVCQVCGGARYPGRALMIERAGDIPLARIEPCLRCVALHRNKRGPACSGSMAFELAAPRAVDPEWAVG